MARRKASSGPLVEGSKPLLHVAKRPESEIPEIVDAPDFAHRLTEPIRKFTRAAQDEGHLSFVQGGGHGGSHPHMVHEFVSAIRENRDPYPNAVQAANWTCVGLLAHESALQGGILKSLPAFTLEEMKRRPQSPTAMRVEQHQMVRGRAGSFMSAENAHRTKFKAAG